MLPFFRDTLYSCTTSTDIKKHIKTHSGERPFICKQCSYSCREATSLKRHMFLHSGVKPFNCKRCKYSCTNSSNLKRHMRKHVAKLNEWSVKSCNEHRTFISWPKCSDANSHRCSFPKNNNKINACFLWKITSAITLVSEWLRKNTFRSLH